MIQVANLPQMYCETASNAVFLFETQIVHPVDVVKHRFCYALHKGTGGAMDYSSDKLGGNELGIYLGILVGIVLFQSTGQIIGLVLCPIVGFAFGTWLDRITYYINLRQGWLEEE